MNRTAIIHLAHRNNYVFAEEQANIGLLIFKKEDVQLNVWATKMTVSTTLTHPVTKRRAQLFRRRVSMKLLAQLFENPRLHTSKGYYGRYKTNATARTKFQQEFMR